MTSSRTSSRSSPTQPSPPPAPAHSDDPALVRSSDLRARRSLAVSKSARDSISQVVESLRVSKPPRVPDDAAAPPTSAPRRRALLLHSGSHPATERVRALEEALDAANTATIAVKRLYGRALVKRRAAERERDTLRAKLDALVNAAEQPEPPSQPATPRRATRTENEDDDRRSCHSFVSSCVFGDDREAQLDSLADLVDMLEAKLSVSTASQPPARPIAALARARATLATHRPTAALDAAAIVSERDALQRQLDAALNATRTGDNAVEAALRAELADARADAAAMRARALALDRLRERAEAADGARASGALSTQLDEAKRAIARLVQERNALRRAAQAAPALTPAPPPPPALARDSPRATAAPPTPVAQAAPVTRDPRFAPSEDVVRRVQTWRERASSEAALPPPSDDARLRRERAIIAGPATVPVSELRRARTTRTPRAVLDLRRLLSLEETLPIARNARVDRATARIEARTPRGQEHLLPARLRSDLSERARASLDAGSERSVDASDAGSAASTPHGIVGRHASFSTTTAMPTGDGLPPVRDFFGAPASSSVGLRGLVTDSLL